MKKIILPIILFASLIACSKKEEEFQTEKIYILPTIERANLPSTSVKPVNEAQNDTSLTKFIDKINQTVAQQDTTMLYSMIHPDIMISEGGALYGKQEFIQDWGLSEPGNSKLWKKLSHLIQLGGAYEITVKDSLTASKDTVFRLPYTQANKFMANIPTEADWYNLAVVITPEAQIFSNSEKAKVAGQANYDIVEILDEHLLQSIVKVKATNNNYTGYVKREDLYYTSDYLLDIKKVDGNWKIVAFAPYH